MLASLRPHWRVSSSPGPRVGGRERGDNRDLAKAPDSDAPRHRRGGRLHSNQALPSCTPGAAFAISLFCHSSSCFENPESELSVRVQHRPPVTPSKGTGTYLSRSGRNVDPAQLLFSRFVSHPLAWQSCTAKTTLETARLESAILCLPVARRPLGFASGSRRPADVFPFPLMAAVLVRLEVEPRTLAVIVPSRWLRLFRGRTC